MGLFDHLSLFGTTSKILTFFSAGTGLPTGCKHVDGIT